MSNSRISQPTQAIWQPMVVLQNTPQSNPIFLQDDYSKPRSSRFKEWSPQKITPLPVAVSKTNTKTTTDELNEKLSIDENKLQPLIDKETWEKDIANAYQKGLQEGIEKGKAESQEKFNLLKIEESISESEKIKNLLQEISEATWALRENPTSLFEPLKRLSIHIAEQLILTELTTSSACIQALIERCIETLDIASSTKVSIELNPLDLVLLQTKPPTSDEMKTWHLQADPSLLPGSIRVKADDAMVSDLVEHRLESIAQSVLTESKSWQAQTAFHPERLNARRGLANAIEDATPHQSSLKEESTREKSSDHSENVLEALPSESFGRDKNISNMNLPDLELHARLINDGTDLLDTPNE